MAKYKQRKVSGYGIGNPIPDLFPNPIKGMRSPASTDNGYEKGQVWINTNPNSTNFNDVWMLTSVTAGVANWESLSFDAGGAAPITLYVIAADGTGDYLTIQEGINAAQAAGVPATVYIKPGQYTENLLLIEECDLVGAAAGGENSFVEIVGIHIPPRSGTLRMSNITFTSATHVLSDAAIGTSNIYFNSCSTNITNGYMVNCPNFTGLFSFTDIETTLSTDDGGINNTGGAEVLINNSQFGRGTGNDIIIRGSTSITCSTIAAPINAQTGSVIGMTNTTVIQPVTFINNSAAVITNSFFNTGASAAITHSSTGTVTLSNVSINSSNTPAIDGAGAGAISLKAVDFIDDNTINGALTLSTTGGSQTTGFACTDVTCDSINCTTVDATGTVTTDSNIDIDVAGGGILIAEGANATSGLANLVAGTVTVNTTKVTANSRIHLTHQNPGTGTVGFLSVSIRTPGTSFTIVSSSITDDAGIAWLIIEPS